MESITTIFHQIRKTKLNESKHANMEMMRLLLLSFAFMSLGGKLRLSNIQIFFLFSANFVQFFGGGYLFQLQQLHTTQVKMNLQM